MANIVLEEYVDMKNHGQVNRIFTTYKIMGQGRRQTEAKRQIYYINSVLKIFNPDLVNGIYIISVEFENNDLIEQNTNRHCLLYFCNSLITFAYSFTVPS